MRRETSVLHGMPTRSRLTVRNGGDCGDSPSMTKSSSSNCPFQSRTLSRPMCIGRSMKRDPCVSACALSAGPRSTVTPVTTATATTTASVATTRRTMTRVRCVSGC